MHLKLTNGQPDKFPYTIEQFRRDNPHTGFPKIIPDSMLKRYGVFPVEELPKPEFDHLVQSLVQDDMPHREIISLTTEKDATNPITGEVDQDRVGQHVYGNRWLIGYIVEKKPHNIAESAIRNKRDKLLSETDWTALSDTTMSAEMAAYRQALRDITDQEGFPYQVDWPVKP